MFSRRDRSAVQLRQQAKPFSEVPTRYTAERDEKASQPSVTIFNGELSSPPDERQVHGGVPEKVKNTNSG